MWAWCYPGRLALFLSRRAKAASPNGPVIIDREALAVEREQVVGVRPDSSTKPVRWLCNGLPQWAVAAHALPVSLPLTWWPWGPADRPGPMPEFITIFQ